jgi:hypothetical protein
VNRDGSLGTGEERQDLGFGLDPRRARAQSFEGELIDYRTVVTNPKLR